MAPPSVHERRLIGAKIFNQIIDVSLDCGGASDAPPNRIFADGEAWCVRDPLWKAPFVKSYASATTLSGGIEPERKLPLTAQNVKSAARRHVFGLKRPRFGPFRQMAAGDATVGSWPTPLGDIPAHAPQDRVTLKMAVLELDHRAIPPALLPAIITQTRDKSLRQNPSNSPPSRSGCGL